MQNRLKELRKKKKLSQKEFAKAFNNFIRKYKDYAVLDNNGKVKKVSQATISRWEVGKTPIPAKYLEALAKYFRVSIAYFLGERFNGFVDPLSQSLADTLTFLPPKVAEKAMDAAYSVIYSYEANQSVHVFELDKYGNIDTKSAFKISKPKKPVDSRWITVFCNHCNKNVQIPYEEYHDLLFYDKPIHCPKCGLKNIRLLGANDNDSKDGQKENKNG